MNGSTKYERTKLRDDDQQNSDMKISKKFRNAAAMYRVFAEGSVDNMDFSDEALNDMYVYESTGNIELKRNNGYALGKQLVNITITMWKESIADGTLLVTELYEDDTFPRCWLDKIFKKKTKITGSI